MNILIPLIAASTIFFGYAKADIETDKQGINTACTQEATTASCGTGQVGTGLVKCLQAYKKTNPSFQYSAACKTAITTLKADIETDKQAIDTTCAQEAKTANCGTKKVGTGLLKCIRAYKKTNKSFQYSAACKTAIATLKAGEKEKNSPTSRVPAVSKP